jgi:hypothetical protein
MMSALWMVGRTRHPGAKPEIAGVHWTPSPAYTQANKLAKAYPAEKIEVYEGRNAVEVKP